MTPQRFPYPRNPEHPDTQGLPFVPLILHSRVQSLQVSALLDSGSMVNVLPYNLGLLFNFFLEFDVYFFGSQGFFEILPSHISK